MIYRVLHLVSNICPAWCRILQPSTVCGSLLVIIWMVYFLDKSWKILYQWMMPSSNQTWQRKIHEHPPFMDDFPIETSIETRDFPACHVWLLHENGWFSIENSKNGISQPHLTTHLRLTEGNFSHDNARLTYGLLGIHFPILVGVRKLHQPADLTEKKEWIGDDKKKSMMLKMMVEIWFILYIWLIMVEIMVNIMGNIMVNIVVDIVVNVY